MKRLMVVETVVWIWNISLFLLLAGIIWKTPSIIMDALIGQWDPRLQSELSELYELHMSNTKQKSLSSVTDVTSLVSDDVDERTAGLKDIHDFIFASLDKLQNDGDCEKKKIIRCTNPMVSGFGVTVHRNVVCLHVALALGRMFIIDMEHLKFNWLANFTRPSKCAYLINHVKKIKDKCNYGNLDCYTVDKYGSVTIDNKYKVLEYNRVNDQTFPAPKHRPGTLPGNIEKRLRELGVEHPRHWFNSQLLGYLILRPNEAFERRYEDGYMLSTLQHPMIGVHFRGTDKLEAEAGYISDDTYFRNLENMIRTRIANSSTRRNIYVASDDSRVPKKIENALSKVFPRDSLVVRDNPLGANLRVIGKRDDGSREELEKMLMDLYFLAVTDYTLVTYSSNIGRLVLELKTSRFPYNAIDTVVSLDAGFSFRTPEPGRYFTVRDNTETTINDGYKITAYKRGRLYAVPDVKDPIRTVNVNGSPTKIRCLRVDPATKQREYAFDKDVSDWPGKVVYKIDIP